MTSYNTEELSQRILEGDYTGVDEFMQYAHKETLKRLVLNTRVNSVLTINSKQVLRAYVARMTMGHPAVTSPSKEPEAVLSALGDAIILVSAAQSLSNSATTSLVSRLQGISTATEGTKLLSLTAVMREAKMLSGWYYD